MNENISEFDELFNKKLKEFRLIRSPSKMLYRIQRKDSNSNNPYFQVWKDYDNYDYGDQYTAESVIRITINKEIEDILPWTPIEFRTL